MHLLIRRTKGYYHGNIDLDHVISDTETVGDAISKWRSKVPYMEFRSRLRSISESSLGQKFRSTTPWSDRDRIEKLPKGAWLLPIDEDDWLHPNLIQIIGKEVVPTYAKVMRWDVKRKQANGTMKTSEFIESCGYALKLPVEWKHLMNHMNIAGLCESTPTLYVCQTLAVRNETPASVGFLAKHGDPMAAIEEAIANETDTRSKMPKWSWPQYDKYMKLLKEAR